MHKSRMILPSESISIAWISSFVFISSREMLFAVESNAPISLSHFTISLSLALARERVPIPRWILLTPQIAFNKKIIEFHKKRKTKQNRIASALISTRNYCHFSRVHCDCNRDFVMRAHSQWKLSMACNTGRARNHCWIQNKNWKCTKRCDLLVGFCWQKIRQNDSIVWFTETHMN